MDNGGGNVLAVFGIEKWTGTSKSTNIVARFRKCKDLIGKSLERKINDIFVRQKLSQGERSGLC